MRKTAPRTAAQSPIQIASSAYFLDIHSTAIAVHHDPYDFNRDLGPAKSTKFKNLNMRSVNFLTRYTRPRKNAKEVSLKRKSQCGEIKNPNDLGELVYNEFGQFIGLRIALNHQTAANVSSGPSRHLKRTQCWTEKWVL